MYHQLFFFLCGERIHYGTQDMKFKRLLLLSWISARFCPPLGLHNEPSSGIWPIVGFHHIVIWMWMEVVNSHFQHPSILASSFSIEQQWGSSHHWWTPYTLNPFTPFVVKLKVRQLACTLKLTPIIIEGVIPLTYYNWMM